MKKYILSGSTLALLLLFFPAAHASWLIDPVKFSQSLHAQISCRDCHPEIGGQSLHPDPADVDKKLSEFFTPEQCTVCHDDITENLSQGTHGSLNVTDPKRYQNCLPCHNPHYEHRAAETPDGRPERPEFSTEDLACLDCHATPQGDDPQRNQKVFQLCFQCHAQGDTQPRRITGRLVPLIDINAYQSVAHAGINCLTCHPRAASFAHNTQKPPNCRQCHPRHDEKVTHDAHLNVACPACHLSEVRPVKIQKTGRIQWQSERNLRSPLKIHDMRSRKPPASCRRCHVKGNTIGAAAMVLPAKSILCMPCHAATFSVGDTATIAALAVFLFGLFMTFSYVLSGSIHNTSDSGLLPRFLAMVFSGIKGLFSAKFTTIVKALILDALLQRRLFQRSVSRWAVHSLIFFPFVFRFSWGMIALLASLLSPGSSWFWFMLDKNNAVSAFLFDLTGLMILIGIALALLRGFKQADRPEDLPDQDRIALGLIGAVVSVGFFLEGLRIAMTGSPHDSAYAFVGYGIHLLFAGSGSANQIFGYVWYLHAVLTGAFIAYLPFSRLLHVIMAPIVLAMRAAAAGEHRL